MTNKPDRYLAYYRPKSGVSKSLRTAEHSNHLGVSEKEFRLTLIQLYVKHKKRIVRIEKL
jgi:hypothetical protein